MNPDDALYEPPPPYRSTNLDRPIILLTYWCSGCALVIVIARILGRFSRTFTVYTDDKLMALTMVPLLLRLTLAHAVLLLGTNNMDFNKVIPGHGQEAFTPYEWTTEQQRRQAGSKIVLAARIAFVAFIWSQKYCITNFYHSLTVKLWSKWHSKRLKMIRWFLLGTFVLIVLTILTECHPFNKYWQIYPDPGPQCRQGVGPLLATVVCSVTTDLLLIFFPMPTIIRSTMPLKRKTFLIFSLSLPAFLVAISIYKIPFMKAHSWSQNDRTLFSSLECLASCAVANAVVLNSFFRDKGPKRNKYRGPGGKDMLYSDENIRNRGLTTRDTLDRTTVRRGISLWGSDVDLITSSGIGMNGELRELSDQTVPHGSLLNMPAMVYLPPRKGTTLGSASPISSGPFAGNGEHQLNQRSGENQTRGRPILNRIDLEANTSRIEQMRLELNDAGGLLR